MERTPLSRLLRGSFRFLRPEPEEVRRLLAGDEGIIPRPQRIFLADEEATPLSGFPVLQSPETVELHRALERYVTAEEEFEAGLARKSPPDRRPSEEAWTSYRELLGRATANSVSSSFGRHYPSVLWLFHSIAVSRRFKESPGRVGRIDAAIGREFGAAIKYRIFNRWLDRVLSATYDIAQSSARAAEEREEEMFPAVLNRMRDNVLILTEDHISRDLAELTSYFRGQLGVDGRAFRAGYEAMGAWLGEELAGDPALEGVVRNVAGEGRPLSAQDLLKVPGFATYLAEREGYDFERFLSDEQLAAWEELLTRLKEFELLVALRRYVVPVHERAGELVCSASFVRGALTGKKELTLSPFTRPLDFMTPWVVDPLVQRFGLVYDITDFSTIISVLRRTGAESQDASFRKIFGFQRRVNRMAAARRLQLEKYLGDGALYSGRLPSRLLAAAIRLQRFYQEALDEGFPFDRGLRIALNYGHYRLLPIEAGGSSPGHRYEFFGHGIVELTRLVTGKTTREIDDIKTLLVGRGYDEREVDKFFAPVAGQDIQLADRNEESRPFFAYVNVNGVLINEGIVATEAFVRQIQSDENLQTAYRVREGGHRYVAVKVEASGASLVVGLRKLGIANLKGLEKLAVYEVVDGDAWSPGDLSLASGLDLLEALEQDFVDHALDRGAGEGQGG